MGYKNLNIPSRPSFYLSLGAKTLHEDFIAKEKTLIEMIGKTKRACENLIRCYKHNSYDIENKRKSYTEVSEFLEGIEDFSNRLLSYFKK